METEIRPPETVKGNVVLFIWRSIPRLFFIGLIVLIVILAGTIQDEKERLAASKAEETAAEAPPVNAVTLALTPETIQERLSLPGSIEEWTRLNLAAQVGGEITEVRVHEGAEIRKGDIIAVIDIRDYRIALDRAQAAYDLARANYERDKAVFAKGVIPKAEMDIKETSLETARADLENARLALSRCTIPAPMNGLVNRLDAKVGLLVSVGDPVAEILKIDQVKAVIGIPESDIAAARRLDTMDLEIKALDGRRFVGRKHLLASSPETMARSYRLELALDNPDRELLPGMFVRADLIKKRADNAVVVPFYSVISRNDEHFVFVEEDGIAKKRLVSLGIMEKWKVQIAEGLSPGEKVIVEGHRDVEDGQEIRVIRSVDSAEGYRL